MRKTVTMKRGWLALNAVVVPAVDGDVFACLSHVRLCEGQFVCNRSVAEP